MVDTSFNTEANIRILQESGIDDRQARAIMEVVRAGRPGGVAGMEELAEIKNDVLWIKRIGGVLVALGVAATGFLYSEIGSVREELRNEIGSVREELRTEIGSVREELRTETDSLGSQIQANSAALARIEAILNERLTRN